MPNADTSRSARLLADIGGTNARMAWQQHPGAPLDAVQVLPCANYPTPGDAIQHYLDGLGRGVPAECAIAIASPVVGDHVQMTNHHWSFSIRGLKASFGFRRLQVLNDFTALALALPSLPAHELRPVGGGLAVADTAIALIGPGTGLGVSGLLPDGRGRWIPLQGEGGHVTLPACTAREQMVVDALTRRFGHASAERAVCGQGLVDILDALCASDGMAQSEPLRTAAGITAAALRGDDPRCQEALELFCAFLGTVAGNLALTLGARGGVYIGGGMVPHLGDWFGQSPFRTRFEAKGRFAAYLAEIPVFVILSVPSPALLGAACSLDAA